MADTETLTSCVRQLEKDMPSLSPKKKSMDYHGFLTAFAVIRGIMKMDYSRADQSYDFLMQELSAGVRSVKRVARQIKGANSSILDDLLTKDVAFLRRYVAERARGQMTSLQFSIAQMLSGSHPDSHYTKLVTAIGKQIRKELYAEPNPSPNRLSPEYMAEMEVLYSVFSDRNEI